MKLPIALIVIVLLIHIEVSCQRASDDQFVFSEYKRSDTFQSTKKSRPDSIRYSKGYEAFLKYDNNGNLQKVYGYVTTLDTPQLYGHIFYIDTTKRSDLNNERGTLISYLYIGTNSPHYSYAVSLNPVTKKYREIFSPFVDYFVYQFAKKDSILKYTFHFSDFPRNIIKASFSYDNKTFMSLPIHRSNLMPFLDEGDVRIRKNIDHLFMKTETKGFHLDLPGLENNRTFLDTVTLYKASLYE